MERNQQRIARRALWLAHLVALGVLLLAVLVLAGWALDNQLLKGSLPSQVAMKANTAVAFALAALALWLLAGRAAASRWQQIALGFALVVAALGAVSLIEYLLGANLGIDQLLFREPVGAFGTSNPGRMAPLTAVCFVLLGTALGCVTRPRLVLTAQPLAVLAAAIGLLSLIGYLYGAEGFYKLGPYSPMASLTAAAFLALGIGVLCARPDAGLMRTVTSGTASSLIARRLLLAAVVLPVAFNWLEMRGQRAGFYDATFGSALAAAVGSLVVIALLWWTAQQLERGERERQQAEQEYRTILETAIDGFWVIDAESRLLEVNEAYCRMTGYSPDELLRMHISDLEATDAPDEIRRHIERVMAKGSDRFERRHRRKDGSIFEVDISVQYLNLRSGIFICFLQDITLRKQAESALNQVNAQLEQSVRMRTAQLENANQELAREIAERKRADDELRIISEIIQGFITTPNLEQFLKLVHRSISQLVYAENCYVMLHDPVNDTIHFEFWVDQHDPPPAPKPRGRGFASYVLRTGLPLRLTREAKKKLEEEGEAEQIGSPSASWLGAPLRASSRTIGVIVLQDYEDENAFTQRDLEFLSSVGDQVALAIERKRAEEALSESEERYRELVENAIDIIYTRDLDGNITVINQAAERITGYTKKEMLATNIAQVIPPEYHERLAQIEAVRITGEETAPYEMAIIAKDGRRITLEANTKIIEKNGVAVGVQGIARDITERRQAEERLRLQGSALEAAANAIVITSRTGTIEWVNPAFCTLTGYSGAEAVGHNPRELVKSGKHDRAFFKNLWATILDGRVWQSETINRRKDGTLYTEFQTITPVRDGQGEISHFVAIKEDITERKQTEKEQARLTAILQATTDMVATADLKGFVQYINQAGRKMLGLGEDEDVTNTRIADYHAEWAASIVTNVGIPAAIERGLWRGDTALLSPDGREIPLSQVIIAHTAPDGTIEYLSTIGRDITERKQAEEALRESEEQLRQSQKMEAIGQLAGGVAHDFNNLLTAINGYSALALQRIDDNHPLKGYLEEIKKAGDRAANLTRQLLAFGRKQILQPLPINLNDVVTDMNKMLRRLIGEDIELTAKLDPALKKIKADPGQIEQVLVNLIVNARDAMPQGGNLTIETVGVDLDQDYANRHVGVVPGSYVMLAVSDTGTGMDEDTQARIFDPFFTTKEKGKGTGLGLSTVYGIVKQSGGNIWVYSELGHGTTFKVYLPELAAGSQKTEAVAVESPIPGGSETILLVEDEDVVRGLARKILEHAGYKVLEASRGDEAVRLCLERAAPIDLLLTDVVMPETSGKEVADRLTKLFPGLRVLFMSGYTDEAIVHHGVLDSNVEFIQKPFTPAALIRKVREVLDSALMISDKVSLLPDPLPEKEGETEVD